MPPELKLKDVHVSGKRVFIRINLNVPLDKKSPDVTSTNRVPLDVSEVQSAIRKRIGCALPTIKYCLEKGATSVVLASHIGRPGGAFAKKYSLEPVATELEKQIRKQVIFLKNCVGPEVEDVCASPAPGSIILLENVRFHIEEEGRGEINGEKVKADEDKVTAFRASLRKLADIYVCDAFGTGQRAHSSSMVGEGYEIKCAGLAVSQELEAWQPYDPKSFEMMYMLVGLGIMPFIIIAFLVTYTLFFGQGD